MGRALRRAAKANLTRPPQPSTPRLTASDHIKGRARSARPTSNHIASAKPQGFTVTFFITTGLTGWLMPPSMPITTGAFAIISTTSNPFVTRAKIT